MTWNNFSDCARLRTVEEIVSDTVVYFRNRGHKRDIALEQAALALGLSQRKTRSIFYGEAVALLKNEYEQIKRSFAAHLDQQAEDLARRSEAARARRRQIELEI